MKRVVRGIKAWIGTQANTSGSTSLDCPAGCVKGHRRDRNGKISRCPRCSGHGKVESHA